MKYHPFEGAEFCRRRKRRALDHNSILLPDDGNADIYIYNPPQLNFSDKSFPTPKGKTEKSVRNTCSEFIRNSTVGKACLDIIKNFGIHNFIDQCVIDVRVSIKCSLLQVLIFFYVAGFFPGYFVKYIISFNLRCRLVAVQN